MFFERWNFNTDFIGSRKNKNEDSDNSACSVDMEKKNDNKIEAESQKMLEITELEEHGGETILKIISDVSLWGLPLQDHLRMEIIKKRKFYISN